MKKTGLYVRYNFHIEKGEVHYANVQSFIEGGLAQDTITVFKLERLKKIRQLQFLTATQVSEDTPYTAPPHTFSHNRFDHSVGAAAIMQAMLERNNVSAAMGLIGVLGAIAHDALTPAGGDMTKQLDMQLFDEDIHIRKIFRKYKKEWDILREKYKFTEITPDTIESMLQGQGILGNLIDIADTCSYLALDGQELAAACGRMHIQVAPQCYNEIFALLAQGACHIWKDVEIIEDRVVVQNVNRLFRFLKLRILLWKHLYENPATSVLSQFILHILRPMFELKKLTRSMLLNWNDIDDFNPFIRRITGIKHLDSSLHIFGEPPVRKSFQTREEAWKYKEKLEKNGELSMFFSLQGFQTKHKTDRYYVIDGKKQSPATFDKAYPAEAGEIKKLAASASTEHPFNVVCFPRAPNVKIGKRFQKIWLQAEAYQS